MKFTKQTVQHTVVDYETNLQNLEDFVKSPHFSQDLKLVSVSSSVTNTGLVENNKSFFKEAILTSPDAERVVKNPENFNDIISSKTGPMMVVYHQEQIRQLQEYGDKTNIKKVLKIKPFVDEKKTLEEKLSSTDYQALEFLQNSDGFQVFKNASGQFITEPVHLEYITSELDNGKYHLDELIEHLALNERVSFLVDKSYHEQVLLATPLKEGDPLVSKIIKDIPGYNATEDQNEYIEIFFKPNSEEAEQILNWVREPKNPIYSSQQFIVQEILNCKSYLKSPPADVEPVVPARKFKK